MHAISWITTGSRLKVIFQSLVLLGIFVFAVNVGRELERDAFERGVAEPYPLRPQSYFGGLSVKHLHHTW